MQNQRGVFLNIENYFHYKHSGSWTKKVYWNCRRKGECSARAITSNTEEYIYNYS